MKSDIDPLIKSIFFLQEVKSDIDPLIQSFFFFQKYNIVFR